VSFIFSVSITTTYPRQQQKANPIKLFSLLLAALLLTTPTLAHQNQTCTPTSYYTLYGHKTASGAIMAPGHTTAHPSLPFGTKLRLTNPANGAVSWAIVNDRGPFIKGRGLDVNKTVAHELGFVQQGVTIICWSVVE
jgi:rare lipoprotein A